MKKFIVACMFAMVAMGSVSAGSDDVKWINQCIKDNADEGQSASVVRAYCTCMNNKMSDDETQSITQWEKTHRKEEEACSKQAGWKDKK